jgi:hypothetical protein
MKLLKKIILSNYILKNFILKCKIYIIKFNLFNIFIKPSFLKYI